MPGGHLLSPVLLVGKEFFEPGGRKGESLPPEAHQVGVLKPGVIEAVLNGRTCPVENPNIQRLIVKSPISV